MQVKKIDSKTQELNIWYMYRNKMCEKEWLINNCPAN